MQYTCKPRTTLNCRLLNNSPAELTLNLMPLPLEASDAGHEKLKGKIMKHTKPLYSYATCVVINRLRPNTQCAKYGQKPTDRAFNPSEI